MSLQTRPGDLTVFPISLVAISRRNPSAAQSSRRVAAGPADFRGTGSDRWRAVPLRFIQLRKEIFGDNFPASALITVAGLARPEMLVEAQGIAVLG